MACWVLTGYHSSLIISQSEIDSGSEYRQSSPELHKMHDIRIVLLTNYPDDKSPSTSDFTMRDTMSNGQADADFPVPAMLEIFCAIGAFAAP